MPDEKDAPAIATPALLSATEEVTRTDVVTLSDEHRITRLEAVINDYITNPPKLADAEALSVRILEIKGMTESSLQQVAALSDRLPGRLDLVEQRIGNLEATVQLMSSASGVAPIVAPHDPAHQTAQVARDFRCTACGTGFSDIVLSASSPTQQKPCPSCGRAVDVGLVTPIEQ